MIAGAAAVVAVPAAAADVAPVGATGGDRSTGANVAPTPGSAPGSVQGSVQGSGGSGGGAAVSGWIYADNWFQLSVNGRVVATDPTTFKPFEVVPVAFSATLPLTIAVIAKDYADPVTGLEYDNTKVGDGGLIVKFANGVASSADWKVKVVERGPLNVDECLATPARCVVERSSVPANWTMPDFDDSGWANATVHTREEVQPHADDFDRYDWGSARFIWGPDLLVDNTVLFRLTVGR